MEQDFEVIRIGRSLDNTKYGFEINLPDGGGFTAPSYLSIEENERIFNEVDKIVSPKNFEPGLFKLICTIQFDRLEGKNYINPIVTKFISLEEI